MNRSEVLPLAGILLTAGLWARGCAALRARGRPVRWRHAAAFPAGLAALAVALLPPVAPLGHVLLSAHMVQHMLLLAVAPPLLLYGRPAQALWAAASPPVRRRIRSASRTRPVAAAERLGSNAVVVVVASVAALWGWHAPPLYTAALHSEAAHAAEHLSFMGTGLALWALVAGASRRRRHGQALLGVFATGLAGAALGAVLTFSTTVFYPVHGQGAAAWGLTPLEDQQLAGSIMWIPPGLGSLVAMVGLLHSLLRESEQRTERREKRPRPAEAAEAP